MDTSQISHTLKDLEEKTNSAFSSSPDILALIEIKNTLLEIKKEERFHFKVFVDDFKGRLFKSGIGLPGESLDYNEPQKLDRQLRWKMMLKLLLKN